MNLIELVDALTSVDERAFTTIENFAKKLRAAGLLQQTKRGFGAVDISLTDATNLLIGISCSDTAVDAPERVPLYRTLLPQVGGYDSSSGQAISYIGSQQTFGEALAVLIEHADKIHADVWVTLSRPVPHASIQIASKHKPLLAIEYVIDKRQYEKFPDFGDAVTRRTVGLKTLTLIRTHTFLRSP